MRVRRRDNPSAIPDERRTALLEEWNNVLDRMINALMNSMHRRIRSASNARRGHTKY